jgi:hypothetical protein
MNESQSIPIGEINGLHLRAKQSAFIAAILIAASIFLFLFKGLKWRPAAAAVGGIMATAVHYLSELWHQVGHARAAQKTGFLMKGVTFTGPLGFSIYPENEGLLPAQTHIQRALGGPIFSVLLALFSGLLAMLVRPIGGMPLFITVFTFLDNLFVFTIGALLPLRFTDGSAILTWLGQMRNGGRVQVR